MDGWKEGRKERKKGGKKDGRKEGRKEGMEGRRKEGIYERIHFCSQFLSLTKLCLL